MRDQVYPGAVSAGRMRRAEAELHQEHMTAVLRTIEWLRIHEAEVRVFLAVEPADRKRIVEHMPSVIAFVRGLGHGNRG